MAKPWAKNPMNPSTAEIIQQAGTQRGNLLAINEPMASRIRPTRKNCGDRTPTH
ncbi:hypothetical protein K9N68_21515 [Kovacikia minuta CCNUW1]|uniref:hypothetical protein n=1 Tax=Kovacikia minuta TaxID=2931930 RepID=UPI001CCC1AC1|nr:hypothetical protein [Kovacikia minuta]UBF24277.1 hypothetical protein K9N68_21515 [Kovacikia minuta CCNUW1]